MANCVESELAVDSEMNTGLQLSASSGLQTQSGVVNPLKNDRQSEPKSQMWNELELWFNFWAAILLANFSSIVSDL